MRRILLTHVTQYCGPGTVAVLLRDGAQVACHDTSFPDPLVRARYAEEHPGVSCLAAQTPEEIHASVMQEFGTVDAVICNDAYPMRVSVMPGAP
jgi:hypothetical protein